MQHTTYLTLVIAKATPLRESLMALLGTMPDAGVIWGIEDVSQALQILGRESARLVLLDSRSCLEELPAVVSRIRMLQPTTHCVALVQDRQEQVLALANGADQAPITGIPADRLYALLQAQIAHRPDGHTMTCSNGLEMYTVG